MTPPPEPPCPVCPVCPTPENPAVACTGGALTFLDALQNLVNTPFVIADAFNANDGPAPWTILGADLIGAQLAVFGLQVEPVSAVESRMSAQVQPTLLLEYRDGTSITRTKFVQFPVAVHQSYVPPNLAQGERIEFHIALQPGGVISNLSGAGASVSFTANLALLVLGYVYPPERLAVLVDYTCAAPPVRYPSECARFIRVRRACFGVSDGSVFIGSIPFQRVGTPPYTALSITADDTNPNVLAVANNFGGLLDLQLSFPASLTFRDSTNAVFTQAVLIYTSVQIQDAFVEPGERVIANLRITNMTLPSSAGNFFVTSIQSVSGGIIIANDRSEQALVTALVDCGPFPIDNLCIITTVFTRTQTE